MFWALLLCNVVIPQAFWFDGIRRSIVAVFVVAVIINIGMWLERILIIWNTLSQGHLPSAYSVFLPTFWDWALLGGSVGFFLFLFLMFARVLPVIAMHDLGKLLHRREQES